MPPIPRSPLFHASRQSGLRLPPGLRRSLGTALQRLGRQLVSTSPTPATDPPALLRARAALTEARAQMPGLLGAPLMVTAESHVDGLHERQSTPPAIVAHSLAPAPEPVSQDGSAPLAAAVALLQEERRELRAEVAALRLIVDELRETLVRLDERAMRSAPALPPAEPDAAGKWDNEVVYPSGSVGVEVRIASVADPAFLHQLRSGLSSAPEIEIARVTRYLHGETSLRLHLRRALRRDQLIQIVRRLIPAIEPLPDTEPGVLLLQLGPA